MTDERFKEIAVQYRHDPFFHNIVDSFKSIITSQHRSPFYLQNALDLAVEVVLREDAKKAEADAKR